MSVNLRDLRAYGSLVMPEDNTTINVGGGIDFTTSVDFSNISTTDNVQLVSDNVSDTVLVTVYGRVAGGYLTSLSSPLNGITPVILNNTTFERLMKAVKSGSTFGNVAVEQVTPVITGNVPVSSTQGDQIQLPVNASNSDSIYVTGILRVTAGTGIGQIGKIIAYEGSAQLATIDRVFTTLLDTTSVIRISNGMFLQKTPREVLTVRRLFYNTTADVPGGSIRNYYEKFFYMNENSLSLIDSFVSLVTDPTQLIQFGLDQQLNGNTSTDTNNRLVTPSGIVFGLANVDIPFNVLGGLQNIGVWLQMTLQPGQASIKSEIATALLGSSS